MLLADVTGTVVMTVKHPAFAGEKLLQVQPLDETGRPAGAVILAIDRAQAGVGDRVLLPEYGGHTVKISTSGAEEEFTLYRDEDILGKFGKELK